MILKGMQKIRLKREDLILTTRVSNKAQFNGNVREEFFRQLKRFNTDYFDVLMFHWPVTNYFQKTWEGMMRLKEEGYCKILGVANCHQSHIEAIYDVGSIS